MITEHNVQVQALWCNDGTADLIVSCDPCGDVAKADRDGSRFTVLFDDHGPLTLEQISEMVRAHIEGDRS